MNKLIARLPLRRKFLLIAVAMLVPIVFLTVIAVRLELEKTTVARHEDRGLRWATPLIAVASNVAEFRDHAIAVAGGAEQERAELMEHAALVRAAANELDKLTEAGDAEFVEASKWGDMRARVAAALEGDGASARQIRDGAALIRELHTAVQRVAEKSELVLDPGADTFPLMFASLFDIPIGVEALAGARRQMEANFRLQSALHYLADNYGDNASIETTIPKQAAELRKRLDEMLKVVAHDRRNDLTPELAASTSPDFELLTEELSSLRLQANQELSRLLEARAANSVRMLCAELGLVMLFLALAFWTQRRVTRYIADKIESANSVFAKLQHGEFDSQIGEQPADELGALLDALREMQAGLSARVEADRQASESDRARAVASERIKQALDASSVNVVVADESFHVIYVNPAAQKLLNSAAADFRQAQPRFDANRLVGSNLEAFYADGARQRDQLAALRQSATTQLVVGSRTFQHIASPIMNSDGTRIGTVVEWLDRTQEVAAEREIGALVDAVSAGKLDQRISMSGKTGFFEVLGRGLNGVVGTVSDVVAELRKLVQSANDGDLTRRMELDGKPALYVSIGSGVNSLVGNMADVVAEVKNMAVQVQSGAEEISKGNLDLSQRTEEQASSLEETASSMEEMTSTVKQTADNAGQANQLAMAARQQAEKGGTVVGNAITAMSGINAASKKIADIIGVIDEIAFQTNLLALNAAVEAARAGEQGRGFAVVATEVRNLAGRSATAAKEIKSLIQDSVARVEEGSKLVDESGATLEEIVTSVKKVTDIVAEIAAASREQSSGIEQVNKAIMQMDSTTQQNAALVEEAAAASRAIVEQTHSLAGVVARYRVNSTSLGGARPGAGGFGEGAASESEAA
jgi:methyl-accepting chemotaxis protein